MKKIIVENYLPQNHYKNLKNRFDLVLAKGFVGEHDGGLMHKFDARYSSYCYSPGYADQEFYDFRNKIISLSEIERFSRIFGVELTGSISISFHHHKPNEGGGNPHIDIERVYFQPERFTKGKLAGIRIAGDPSYPYRTKKPTVGSRAENRCLTFLLYLNDNWKEGDGGETAFYKRNEDKSFTITEKVAPIGNRLLVFNNVEGSWHSSLPNGNVPRNSLVWWMHTYEGRVT
jgi:2OG-Fe(II) oxygenase superfamily